MGTKIILFFTLSIVFLDVFSASKPASVETVKGTLEGTSDGLSRGGRRFYQFRGIQYGVVGERFTPATEVQPWTGAKKAKEFGPNCQDVALHGVENCLFLNVYTPRLPLATNDKPLPVAFFIHGGSFWAGASDLYGPRYFMDEDVVIVTINYRLGILGFLSTGDSYAAGNWGMKDQVLALQWVQENIEKFGGDKNNVTIFGQSAGGASVTYLMVSPLSQGLFHKAIAQSGTFLTPWAFTKDPMNYARKTADALGSKDVSSSEKIVEFLRTVPVTEIATRELIRNTSIDFFQDPLGAFGPVIEPQESGAFLTENPYKMLTSGRIAKVPLMTGVARNEGVYLWAALLFYETVDNAPLQREKLRSNWSQVAPDTFYYRDRVDPKRYEEIGDKIKRFYFGNDLSEWGRDKKSSVKKLGQIYNDRLFATSLVDFINEYSKLSPTYSYLYNLDNHVTSQMAWEKYDFWQSIHEENEWESTHGSDLDAMWNPIYTHEANFEGKELAASQGIVKLWVSFMTDGKPSKLYGTERTFNPVDPNTGLQSWYLLDEDTMQSPNVFAKGIQFWKSLLINDYDF